MQPHSNQHQPLGHTIQWLLPVCNTLTVVFIQLLWTENKLQFLEGSSKSTKKIVGKKNTQDSRNDSTLVFHSEDHLGQPMKCNYESFMRTSNFV